jgi:hypothetical protein
MSDFDNVSGEVSSNISQADDISQNTLDQAQSFLDALQTAAESTDIPYIKDPPFSYKAPDVPFDYKPESISEYLDNSDFKNIDADFDAAKDDFKDKLKDIDISDIQSAADSIDSFTDTPPNLDTSGLPNTFNENAPNKPNISNIHVPYLQNITLPQIPSFNPINIPNPPIITMPSFTAQIPVDDIQAPSDIFEYHENPYTSELASELKDKLINDIKNGGTGLSPEIEQAIWDREVERDNKTLQETIEKTIDTWTARGFDLPDGVITAEIDKVFRDYEHSRLTRSRDIAIKQAELAQKNTQFTVEESIKYETELMNYSSKMADRALQAAKYIADFGIALFNAKVQEYNVKLEAYKTEAQVFESKIRAELTKTEIFKSQIEAAKIESDVQLSQVALYKARIEGLSLLVEIYKNKVEAFKAVASLEATKLEAYKFDIQAYSEKIRAKSLEYSAYKAKMDGQIAEQEAFKHKALAYKTKVEGIEAQIRAYTEANKGINEENKSVLEAAKLSLNTLVAKYQALTQQGKVNSGIAAAIVENNSNQYKALAEQAKLAVNSNGIFAKHLDNESMYVLERAKSNLGAFIEMARIKETAAASGAQVYAGMANAALSAVNTLVSLGYKATVSSESSG